MMRGAIVDVWDITTFDAELRSDLDAHADLIQSYMITSRRLWLERDGSDHTRPYPDNPYAGEFMAISDYIGAQMEERTIRAWHYTRMTDAEAETVRSDGIHMSTPETLRVRLSALVAAGNIKQAIADQLFADSPFQSDQRESRSDKFWMVSHPHEIEDGGVQLLLESWGGEAAYFWQRDPELQDILRSLGTPRVLEIAVPMTSAWSSSSAGIAVVSAFGRWLGCRWDSKAFDLYAHHPLSAENILVIHSEG